ncbi:MAG: hypothetical protein F6K40_03815 [Okeania sp. SIO3I5]|nr:hypothetical protein [Okeania sp. SIO3I5]NEQ35472.1 hypothetical protein [Okeania sp. SIO3I5]
MWETVNWNNTNLNNSFLTNLFRTAIVAEIIKGLHHSSIPVELVTIGYNL